MRVLSNTKRSLSENENSQSCSEMDTTLQSDSREKLSNGRKALRSNRANRELALAKSKKFDSTHTHAHTHTHTHTHIYIYIYIYISVI